MAHKKNTACVSSPAYFCSCEANPKPLSEYITALVRKEKPIEELIEICNDQLKVFLQDNTTKFVNELFDVIADKSYLSAENSGRNSSPKQIKEEDHSSGSPYKRDTKSSSRSSRYNRRHESSYRRHRSRSRTRSSSSSSGDYRSHGYRNSRNSRTKTYDKHSSHQNHSTQGGFTYPTGYFNDNVSNNATQSSVWQDGINTQHSIQTLTYNNQNNWNNGQKRSNNRSPPKNIISVPIVDEKKSEKRIYSQNRNPSYDPENPSINSSDTGADSKFPEDSEKMQVTYEPSPIKGNSQQQEEDPVGILVTRIPWHSNNLENLSNHFSQFGKIINVECNFQQSNSKALVEFSNKYEVQAAFRSPEPILSNRFIRIFLWGPNGIINDSQVYNNFQNNNNSRNKRKHPPPSKPIIAGPGQTKWVRKSDGSHPNGDSIEQDIDTLKAAKRDRRFRIERGKNEASCSDSDESNEEMDHTEAGGKGLAMTKVSNQNDDSAWISQLNKQKNNTSGQPRSQRLSESEPAKLRNPVTVNPMELFKEAKLKYEALQKNEVQRLTIQLKGILEQLESMKENPQDSENKENLKKELFEEAKNLHKEIQEIKEKGIIPRKSDPKSVDKGSKPQLSTLNNAAGKKLVRVVNSCMDGQAASKRIERIDQINKDINEISKLRDELKGKLDKSQQEETLDTSAQIIKTDQEIETAKTSLQEMNRKILMLKRELISLETITMSDLAAASQKNSHKAQTKLDKRPRTLFIKNLSANQVEDYIYLTKMNYLHIEDHKIHQLDETDADSIILEVTYRTRDFAESAQAVMSNYLRKPLLMSFTPPESLRNQSTPASNDGATVNENA